LTLFTGKLPATVDDRDLDFAAYVDTDLIDLNSPPPEKTPGHASLMPKPRLMLGNGPDNSVAPGFQGAGNCVFAGITNFQRLAWAVARKGLFPATGLTAIQNYSEVTGYVLNDPATDNGTNMRTAMNWWRNTGYKDAAGARHKIGGYAAIKFQNANHLKWALYLSDEGILTGIVFYDLNMQQFDDGESFAPPAAGTQPEGGHCILADYWLKVETWAQDHAAAEDFLLGARSQVDEAYFPVDEEGLVNGKTIEGFDSQQLLADAKALA
jgi:hypothetical protein